MRNKNIKINKIETWIECSFCGEENYLTEKEKFEFREQYEYHGHDYKLLKECKHCKESYFVEYTGDGSDYDDINNYWSEDVSDYDCF